MRIFFVSHDFSGISLCRRLRDEGHEVRAWVERADCRELADAGLLLVPNRSAGVRWAGREGLIVCDDVGFGAWQDRLRRVSYAVVGGSAAADRLELDRAFGQRVFARHGLCPVPTHEFRHTREALRFVRAHPGEWVLKLNGDRDRSTTYVGELPDGADVADVLTKHGTRSAHCVLQRRVHGVEIGVARWFNGRDWVGPVEFNVEHKRLFPGDHGPNTAEMGTLMWYVAGEDNRLFQATLARLRPWLVHAGFRGDVDINLIVNADGAYPLEATARFGYPALQLQMTLHHSPWGEFLRAVARSESPQLDWRRGYGVAVLVAVPPFPFGAVGNGPSSGAVWPVRLRSALSVEERSRLHLDGGVAREGTDGAESLEVIDPGGYALHVTGVGASITAARRAAYGLADKLVVPNHYRRDDIGVSFAADGLRRLREWGWL